MHDFQTHDHRLLNAAARTSPALHRITAALGLAFAMTLAPSVQAQPPKTDVPKSADHPLVSRIPGSVIANYAQVDFDDFLVPLGKLAADGTPAKSETVEGKITRIVYATPAPRSLLEVFKNFQDGLNAGGFKILFACANEACLPGGIGPTQLVSVGREDWSWSKGQRFLAARRSGPAGDVTVTVHVGQWSALDHGTETVLFVTEARQMDTGLVKVDAKSLGDDLASKGHAAVYGIYFDTAKAIVKPRVRRATATGRATAQVAARAAVAGGRPHRQRRWLVAQLATESGACRRGRPSLGFALWRRAGAAVGARCRGAGTRCIESLR